MPPETEPDNFDSKHPSSRTHKMTANWSGKLCEKYEMTWRASHMKWHDGPIIWGHTTGQSYTVNWQANHEVTWCANHIRWHDGLIIWGELAGQSYEVTWWANHRAHLPVVNVTVNEDAELALHRNSTTQYELILSAQTMECTYCSTLHTFRRTEHRAWCAWLVHTHTVQRWSRSVCIQAEDTVTWWHGTQSNVNDWVWQ